VKLQQTIHYQFKNKDILKHALIHRSFINENKDQKLESNERLEFLGDAILEFWVSNTLFKLFPTYSEGDLTNLRSLIVCTENLAQVAKSIELGNFVHLSRGEEQHGGRNNISILADTFESLIGAIFTDSSFESVAEFLEFVLSPVIKKLSKQKVYKDAKSIFQEIAQAKEGITPHYQTISESGPDHQKIFEVGVYLNTKLIASGTGNSKQKAEESASVNATKIYKNQV